MSGVQWRFTPHYSLKLPLVHQGKTRETYSVTREDELLVVATDRLSTHNVVHLSAVPRKGEVLTAMTIFMLTNVLSAMKLNHHLVAFGSKIYDFLPGKRHDYPTNLHHRAIIIKKLEMVPIEFIWRAYLAGSLYREFYAKSRPDPYGLDLEPGLPLMTEFADAVFTPTDKSETDDPVKASEVEAKYQRAVDASYLTFVMVRDYLNKFGLELVDSKFELGLDKNGNIALADEIVTPDSSRFCLKMGIQSGSEPPWLDKQIARDEAERAWNGGKKVPLVFYPETIQKLSRTYLDVLALITEKNLEGFQSEYLS